MKSPFLKALSLAVLFFQLSGCMSLYKMQNFQKEVKFDANIPNTLIECSGKKIHTPGSIPLKQSKNHVCTAQMQDHQPQVFKIKSGVTGRGFATSTGLNLAAWGWYTFGIGVVVGWAADFAFGAMKELDHDKIYIEMQPLNKPAEQQTVFSEIIRPEPPIVIEKNLPPAEKPQPLKPAV